MGEGGGPGGRISHTSQCETVKLRKVNLPKPCSVRKLPCNGCSDRVGEDGDRQLVQGRVVWRLFHQAENPGCMRGDLDAYLGSTMTSDSRKGLKRGQTRRAIVECGEKLVENT